jgi:release factor glutamine methyltransferase
VSPAVYDIPGGQRSTLSRAILAAVTLLSRAGVASPRVDAELLAAHVLGVPRSRLAIAPPFDDRQRARFQRLTEARAARVPLQHLLGTAPFRGLELAVGPGVFVPRPETELLVEWGLAAVGEAPVVVDLCAGSGAIALSVAVERPRSKVDALERAPEAVAWLRRNVARIAPRVRVVEGDVTDVTVLSTLDGQVDLVLSNPPYLPDGAPVDAEVAEHDPAEAVFGGADGLALVPDVIARAAALLRPGGALAIEHDESHGSAVPALLARNGHFADVADHADLAGRARFATARRLAD